MKKELITKINIYKTILFLIVGIFVFNPLSSFKVFASVLYMQSESSVFLPEHQVAIDVKLDTEGVEVNALKASVLFPDQYLEFESVYERGSMITAWVEPPKVSGNAVIFSGIMAGGYNNTINPITKQKEPGTVLRIIFKTHGEGDGKLIIQDTELYKNDGLGTKVNITANDFVFNISNEFGKDQSYIKDIYPPEPFTPLIDSDENIFDGKYCMVFHTTDKQTGVAYYEVKEGHRSWERVDSPYLLKDQTLRSVVWVKAVDYAGNIMKEQINGTAIIPMIIIVAIIIIIICALILTMRKVRLGVQYK